SAGRFVDHDDDHDPWIAQRSKANERTDKLRRRISLRSRIDLLRRSSLSGGGITIQLGLLRSATQRYAFEHPAQGNCSLLTDDASLFGLCAIHNRALSVSHLANQVRRDAHAVVRYRQTPRPSAPA